MLEPPVCLVQSKADFAVVFPKDTWEQMQAHAQSVMDKEVGGVLIGAMFRRQDGRPWLRVDAAIPALAAESRSSNVTFTAEAWTKIHELIDREHPGAAIVGWYHTHPGFGIFLSDMDVFIQQHFFNLPHQIAVVIDPVAQTHGCFVWRNGTPTNEAMWIEGTENALVVSPPVPGNSPSTVPSPVPFSASRRSLSRALDFLGRLDRAQWSALATLGLLTVVLLTLLAMVFTHGN